MEVMDSTNRAFECLFLCSRTSGYTIIYIYTRQEDGNKLYAESAEL